MHSLPQPLRLLSLAFRRGSLPVNYHRRTPRHRRLQPQGHLPWAACSRRPCLPALTDSCRPEPNRCESIRSMRSAELTVPAARGGALRLPAGAAWSGSRSSPASGTAGRPASMCSFRLVVQSAAVGKRAPSDPLSRPPRGVARLHHTSQPKRLEGANHIVPVPQHCPLPIELDHQQAQPASSSAPNGSSSTPAAPAAGERTADRAAVASAGTASHPATPAGRISWTDGRTASQLAGLHRPAGLVVGSAWLLAVSLELSGEAGCSRPAVVRLPARLPLAVSCQCGHQRLV